jgi:hypothetical protein
MSYTLSAMVGRLWTKPALFLSCSGSDGSGLGGGAFHSPSPVRCHPPCQLSPDDVMSSTYLLPPRDGVRRQWACARDHPPAGRAAGRTADAPLRVTGHRHNHAVEVQARQNDDVPARHASGWHAQGVNWHRVEPESQLASRGPSG